MNNIMKITITIFVFGIALYGCYNDSEEYLYPNITNNCDTTNITYSRTIKTIISESCLSCHQGSGAGGGVDLSSYSNVKTQADNGKLLGTIKQLSGFSPMPKGTAKLSDCKINQVDIWIRKGSQNN